MGIVEDFQKYVDKHDLVSPDGKPSGNGICYSAEALICTHDNWESDVTNWNAKILRSVENCIKENYVMRNAANEFGQIGPDDLFALAYAAKIDLIISMKVSLLMRRTAPLYVWNNEQPGKFTFSAFFGRNPIIIASLSHGTGSGGMMSKLLVKLGILWAALTGGDEKDNWRISYFLVRLIGWKSIVCRFWYRRLKKQFPGGMRQVYSEYFKNPDHPISKWSKY